MNNLDWFFFRFVTIHAFDRRTDRLQFVTPLIGSLSMICWLRLKIPPAGAHSVLKIVQIRNRNAIHALLQSPSLPIQRSQSGLLGAYRRFNEVRHGTLQELDTRSTSLDATARRPAETRNARRTSEFWRISGRRHRCSRVSLYTVSQKTSPFYFSNNSVKKINQF